MKKSKDILNKAISSLKSEPVPPGPPQETIDATLAKLTEAAGEADTVTAEKQIRVVESIKAAKRFTRIAAAAVIIATVLIGAKIFTGPGKEPEEKVVKQQDVTETEVLVETAKDDEPRSDTTARSELEKIEQMFAAGDIDGLVAMLSAEQLSSRLIATIYLAKIGDLRTVETLEKLSAEHRDDESSYLFALAASMIKSRLEQEKQRAQSAKAGEEESGVAPTAKESLPKTKDTITYRGVVTNEDGGLIEAVTVRSELHWSGLYSWSASLKEVQARTRTDGEGRFEIGPVSVIDKEKIWRALVFEHREYATGWFDGRWTGNNLKIVLLEPSFVAGWVTDEQGNGIEGANVSANLQEDRRCHYMGKNCNLTTRTNSDGSFLVEKVFEGARLHIDVLRRGFVRYTTRDYSKDSYPVRAGEENLLITLKPGGVIRGRLVSEGKPYQKEGIVVRASAPGEHDKVVTDKNGHFEIIGLKSSICALAVDNKYLAGAGLICRPQKNVEIRTDMESTVELELQKGLPVTAKILDEDTGEGVTEHRYSVILKASYAAQIISGKTDARGQCGFRLVPGDYVFKTDTWVEGRYRATEHDFSVKTDSNELTLEVAITPRPMIYGRLVGAKGRPIRGYVWFGQDKINTDERGEFEVPEPQGSYPKVRTCYAFDEEEKSGWAFCWQKADDVRTHLDDLEITVRPLATIFGRVVADANGEVADDTRPQIGVFTRQRSPGGEKGASFDEEVVFFAEGKGLKKTIDADGTFSIEGVPVGLPTLVQASKAGFSRGGRELPELEPGQVVDMGDIVLEAPDKSEEKIEWDATLSGQVTDENGEPMVGVNISVIIGDKGDKDITDINGRYELAGLPKGKKVQLDAYFGPYSRSFNVVCDGNDFDIQIFPEEQK